MQSTVAGVILRPKDMTMLARVLTRCLPASATLTDRESEASALIVLFGAGITDEGRLIELRKRRI